MAVYGGTQRLGGGRGAAPGTPAYQVDPHEAAWLNIRYVDELVTDVADYNTLKVIKLLGGLDSFTFNAAAIEWIEEDLYLRSDVTTASIASGAVAVTMTGKAHRYPTGTVLMFYDHDGTKASGGQSGVGSAEYVWVSGQTDDNTLAIVRDFTALVGATTTVWASGTRFYVVGCSNPESTTWTNRRTSLRAVKYNVPMIFHEAVQSTFRNEGIRRYGTPTGADFDQQVARALQQKTLALEQACLLGRRYVGTGATDPAMMGGVLYYVDSSYDSNVQETDKAGAALTLADINNMLQNIAEIVGDEKVAKTIITDYWGQRKINSFFEPSVRLQRAENKVGLLVQTIDTVVGPVEVIHDTNMPRGHMLFLNPNQGEIGHMEGLGRLHTADVGYTPGDYFQRYIYGDYSMKFRDPVTCGKIFDYSISA